MTDELDVTGTQNGEPPEDTTHGGMTDPAPRVFTDEEKRAAHERMLAEDGGASLESAAVKSEARFYGLSEAEVRNLPERDKFTCYGEYIEKGTGNDEIDRLCTDDVIGILYESLFAEDGREELRSRRVYATLADSMGKDPVTRVPRDGFYWNPWAVRKIFQAATGTETLERGLWMRAGYIVEPRVVGYSNRNFIPQST